jgi:thioredoxin 1
VSGRPGDGPTAADEPVSLGETDGLASFVSTYDVVLVEFYADWCGPCTQLEPVVENVAERTDAAVLTVDIDADQGLATENNVRSVPTMLLYVGGNPAQRLVGRQNEGRLTAMIESQTGEVRPVDPSAASRAADT